MNNDKTEQPIPAEFTEWARKTADNIWQTSEGRILPEEHADMCMIATYRHLHTLPPSPVGEAAYKKQYTIGALFSPGRHFVVLIKKERPEWQKGKYNLPGGHIEEGETALECVRREFIEETGVAIDTWKHIGRIDNTGSYFVDFFAAFAWPNYPELLNETDEHTSWHSIYHLPNNCISNLYWLIPFAKNILEQGNHDILTFGHFKYEY